MFTVSIINSYVNFNILSSFKPQPIKEWFLDWGISVDIVRDYGNHTILTNIAATEPPFGYKVQWDMLSSSFSNT